MCENIHLRIFVDIYFNSEYQRQLSRVLSMCAWLLIYNDITLRALFCRSYLNPTDCVLCGKTKLRRTGVTSCQCPLATDCPQCKEDLTKAMNGKKEPAGNRYMCSIHGVVCITRFLIFYVTLSHKHSFVFVLV